MSKLADRLTAGDVACWLLKSRTAPQLIVTGWQRGSMRQLSRCVHQSYRTELMGPGQRCLLWLSGREQPGVHAIGELSCEAENAPDRGPRHAEIAVSWYLLEQPVPRASLVSDHVVSRAEVVRMPAGSNPSYLCPKEYEALRDFIDPAELAAAGW